MSHDPTRRTAASAARAALRTLSAVLVVLGGVTGALTPAAAAAPGVGTAPRVGTTEPTTCPQRAVEPLLAAFDDPSLYYVAPGGSFEGGSTSWTAASGVRLVAENEPWQIEPGTRSLAVGPGGRTTSPQLCLEQREESMRLFVKAPGRPGSRLAVTTTTQSARGTRTTTTLIDGSRAGWLLTPPVKIPDTTAGSGVQLLRISLSTRGPGTFLVDDVLIDPWRIF